MSKREGPLVGDERFEHPFHGGYDEGFEEPTINHPRTLIELSMYKLSWTIRQKDRWWEKMRDETIRNKWIEEVREQEQQADLPWYHRFTDNMLAYVFAELEDIAEMVQENGIQSGPYDRIWFSDTLVPSEVMSSFNRAVKPLEDVPDEEKDWHPGSNEQVLDLVHPSVCPLVYGKTFGVDGKPVAAMEKEYLVSDECHSTRFQWLPSDFAISETGKVKLVSPYINNIHPSDHENLVPLLESLIQRAALPLWQRVLSDLRWPSPPTRLKDEVGCIWPDGEVPDPYASDAEEPPARYEEEDAWFLRHVQQENLPDCGEYEGNLKKFFGLQEKVDLSGRNLQVIVKLANIVLTPEKPEYPGGKWHVEGMNNEHIVSTFIYYYNSENIEDATLSFRRATSSPVYHMQGDDYCMTILYEMDRDDTCVQDVGGMTTKQGRCLAFPNLYQHQVSSFKLVDQTKPGHRKIVVLFLVDPTVRIPSATEVPVRQLETFRYILPRLSHQTRLSVLPNELLDYIAFLTPGVMDRAEANAIRDELIAERIVFRDEVDKQFFGHEFNMCEH